MEHSIDSELPIVLNTQTVKGLLKQTDLWINQESASENQNQVMHNLKAALEAVLPFLPHALPNPVDELSLEEDIRKEIKIAGANENG